ncbi:uncharacterized protein LOC130390632 [Gadus chalcogrammus]|uniref:uncharacterized protein LOC130390632 n=1 Tax=Gadus chalcogrammus TaxID=1042646 RepID=UPI0024C4D9A4|nr:uncharacterized protein LOC130390632 [Gadus chalcogrammus]XP_056456671.1 uncharacterized protein LOC130390632 [Gadus chalcogrammus]XP_056456672.1 uncharacterized protein LOC130390632 [Gadus chalcogrammus]XP_056456673.1 uncharacterized protein LOC130390632 [Gadus chalcogrammus]
MHIRVLLMALFALPPLSSANQLGEESKTLCLGNELSMRVSSSSNVVYTPNSPPGPTRTIFNEGSVMDPRFEWTTDRNLLLKEVTFGDEGNYNITHPHGIPFQTVHLTVSECLRSYQVNYGENFQHRIPDSGYLLEFSPMGSPPEARPVLLWNRTDPGVSQGGRGHMQYHRALWLVRRVTPADQGLYTMRSKAGSLMSHSRLIVQGHTSNVTRFTKEFVNLPLFVPAHNATLTFTPTRSPDDPRPHRDPVQLVRHGLVVGIDADFQNRVSVYGSDDEVVITGLSPKHTGVYDIRDREGNLVSSTSLYVIEKMTKLRAIMKSFVIPTGMILLLASLFLSIKHYPNCWLSKVINCLIGKNSSPSNPPRINVQDYSPDVHQPLGSYTQPQQAGTPRKWSPQASPALTNRTPLAVAVATPLYPSNGRGDNQGGTGFPGHTASHPAPTSIGASFASERNNSFSVLWASDCLHSSEDCVQFQSKRDKDRGGKGKADFSALPLDRDNTADSTVYTSDKLNFL